MSPVTAAILGAIEGFTEFLPVSSTGHLIIASSLLHVPASDFLKTFEIAIQLGAILAVVALYLRSFFDIEILKRLIVAFIPTGIIGLLMYKIVKTYLLDNTSVVLWALALGGAALIAFEMWHAEREDARADIRTLPYGQAALIGLFQAAAIVPGVSRSAATIVGGLILGLKRTAIVEFSFLLAVPTMAAATGLDLLKNASSFAEADFLALAIGFCTAFAVAILAIKFLLAIVRRYSFVGFGAYRILAALAFALLLRGGF